jgi:hypothetical protein
VDATTLIAVCALVVSVASTALAAWTAFEQRKHMRLSVRPIAAVTLADFENRVGVFLVNKGLGPMRVVSFRVVDAEARTYGDIVSAMPELEAGVFWSNFHGDLDGAALAADRRVECLVLEGTPADVAFTRSRDRVRRSLGRLTIQVTYEDLYGQTMERCERKLDFFARHEPGSADESKKTKSRTGSAA